MTIKLYMDNMSKREDAASHARPVPKSVVPEGPAPRRDAVIRRVPAVSRAVAILRVLSRSEAPLGVHQVSRALGLIPSTCLHILRALVAEELVSFDPVTKRYGLASGIVSLARGMLRHDQFSNLAQPILDEIADRHGVTAIGVEAASLDHIAVVAMSRPRQALRLQVDIGSRYPALISASGRCIAAFGGHAQGDIEQRFKALRWDNPPSLTQWRDDVEVTRKQGFAVDEGRYIAGVTIIAAPVLRRDRVSHALVVVGVGEQLRRIGHGALGEELRERAAALSEHLRSI